MEDKKDTKCTKDTKDPQDKKDKKDTNTKDPGDTTGHFGPELNIGPWVTCNVCPFFYAPQTKISGVLNRGSDDSVGPGIQLAPGLCYTIRIRPPATSFVSPG